MRTLVLTLTLEADGRPYEDSPIRLVDAAPLARIFSFEIPEGEGYSLIPTFSGLSQITSFILTTTAALTLWVNGISGDGIPLEAGAVVALMGLTDTIGLPLWQITNGSGIDARVRGVALGTA